MCHTHCKTQAAPPSVSAASAGSRLHRSIPSPFPSTPPYPCIILQPLEALHGGHIKPRTHAARMPCHATIQCARLMQLHTSPPGQYTQKHEKRYILTQGTEAWALAGHPLSTPQPSRQPPWQPRTHHPATPPHHLQRAGHIRCRAHMASLARQFEVRNNVPPGGPGQQPLLLSQASQQ